jgi:gas vesicle protein
MKSNNSVLYFLLGAAAGAIGGMLYAPQGGTETRDYLKERMREGAESVKKSASDAAEFVQSKATDLKESALQGVRQAEDAGKRAYGEVTGNEG